jgi:steroid delta-isomerase-like uncharacterized protein
MTTAGTDLSQRAAQLIEAFNRADWDSLRDSVAADVVYSETGTGRRVERADAYLELCHGWKAAFPDVTGTVRATIASHDTVAQEIVWDGSHTGALQTADGVLEATGNRIHVQAASWIRYADDRAQEIHHHLDVLTLLQQVQGTPTPNP